MDASQTSEGHLRGPRFANQRTMAYVLFITKVPEPVQPPLPVKFHFPEIVFPATVPVSIRLLPEGTPDITDIPKLPETCPLKFPLRPNEPLSVSPEAKQGELVVNWKFVMFSDPSPFSTSDVAKLKTVELLLPIRVAFQVPLIFPDLEFEPQPTRITPSTSNIATANCFIRGCFLTFLKDWT